MATAKRDKGRGDAATQPVTAAPTTNGAGHGQGKGGGKAQSQLQTGAQIQAPSVAGALTGATGKSGPHGAKGKSSKKSSQPAAPVALPAAAASTATPAPASTASGATRSTRSVTGTRSRSTRSRAGAGAAGRRAAAGPAARAVAAAAVTPAATAAALGSGAGSGATAHGVRGRRGPGTHRTVGRDATEGAPVARTAERIVNIVPWPMWALIGVLAALILALGTRSWIGDRQRRRLRQDVGLLQSALLPAVPATMAAVATSAAYRPADGPGAGGDFYDLFELGDGRLAVVVGDLSGHGREVLPQTALTRYTLRAYLDAGLTPRAALQTAAGVLGHQLEVAFATVALAVYDPRRRTLVYALAGHPPPIVIPEGAVPAVTAAAAAPLGAGLTTGVRQTTVVLPGGATVCFYTDGLVEARRRGELFGEERLRRTLAELGPGAGAEALLNRVAEQCDHRPDDMAACVLGFAGDALAPVAREEELEVGRRELGGARPAGFLLACGVDEAALPRVFAAAAAALEHADAAVMRVSIGDGPPTVRVRPRESERLSALQPVPDKERSLP